MRLRGIVRNCEDTCSAPDVGLEKWLWSTWEPSCFLSSESFIINIVCVYASRRACNILRVEVKGQFCGVSSLYPPLCGLLELTQATEYMWQKPSPLSHLPSPTCGLPERVPSLTHRGMPHTVNQPLLSMTSELDGPPVSSS